MSSMEKKRQQIKYFTKKKKAGNGPMEKLNVEKLHISNMVFKSEANISINFDNPEGHWNHWERVKTVCSPDGPSDCLYRLIFFTDSFAFLVILNILFKLTCVSNRIKEVQITQMDGDQNQNLIIIVNVSRSRGKRMAPWTWNNHLSEKDPSQYLERCDLVGNRVINSFIFITSKISNHFYFSKNCI